MAVGADSLEQELRPPLQQTARRCVAAWSLDQMLDQTGRVMENISQGGGGAGNKRLPTSVAYTVAPLCYRLKLDFQHSLIY